MQVAAATAAPDGVSGDRIIDFDIYGVIAPDAEYQLAIKNLNAPGSPDLFWTPRNGGHWVVTRAALIEQVLSDHAHFSSRSISVPKEMNANPPLMPLQIDPPDHVKYRMLLAGAMSPKAVQPLGEKARALSIELIEGFMAKGECEFIGDFAQHLPVAVFMSLTGLPDTDRELLSGIADTVLRHPDPQVRFAALQRLGGYGMQKIAERRRTPGDDLISTIAQAKVDGAPIDDATLAGMITLLLLAGLDTVVSMLGFFTLFLSRNDAHRRQLIEEPALIPNAVEELLRRFPVAVVAREVAQALEMDGQTLRPGEMVVAPTALDGLDERKFSDPLTVDFKRPRPLHATFGGGEHRCLGSMLARTELRIFLEEWLKRVPDFKVKPGVDIEVRARTVATITSLPLVWNVAA